MQIYPAKCGTTPKNHERFLNPLVTRTIQQIGAVRPTYGTRRMAAAASRNLGMPVNRKSVRRIFQKLGWIEPTKTKLDIIGSARRNVLKPTAPNQLWQTDMTYVWCGIDIWCYCFNVIDVFTRKQGTLDVSVTKDVSIQSIVNTVSAERPDTSRLTIRTDNGSQYIRRMFRESSSVLGARHEFIYVHTPEQNCHVESFHHTLKKEDLWPHDFANYQEAESLPRRFQITTITGFTRPLDTSRQANLPYNGR